MVPVAVAAVATLVLIALVVHLPQHAEANDPSCWTNGLNYEFCCQPARMALQTAAQLERSPNGGNTFCWDGMFNYKRCCDTFSMSDVDEYYFHLEKR